MRRIRFRLKPLHLGYLFVIAVLILGTAPVKAWEHDNGHGGSGSNCDNDDDHGDHHNGGGHDDDHGDHNGGGGHDDDHDGHHGDHDGHHGDDDDDHGCDHRVKICHLPPGNPANFQTLTVDSSAVPAHLAHGDLLGSCTSNCDTLCDDGNPCTVDACDSSGRCKATHAPVNCDDGNRCTIDICSPATGCVNAPKSCADSNLCTSDSCNRYTGACVNAAICCPAGKTCNAATGSCQSTGGSGTGCTPNPCLNGGTCLPQGTSFVCQCINNGNPAETTGNVCACAPGCAPNPQGGCTCPTG